MGIPNNFGGGTALLTNADGSFEVEVGPDGVILPGGAGLDGANINDLAGSYQINVQPGWTGSEPENPTPTFIAGPDGSMGWFDANTGQRLGDGMDENQSFFLHAARMSGVDPTAAYQFAKDSKNAEAVSQAAAPLIAENKRGSSTGVIPSILGGVGGMINDLPTALKVMVAISSMGNSLAAGAADTGAGEIASNFVDSSPEIASNFVDSSPEIANALTANSSAAASTNTGFIQQQILNYFPSLEKTALKAATNAVQSALLNAGKTAITGGDISDILKSGAVGAISGGVGSVIPNLGPGNITGTPWVDSAINQGIQTGAGGALSGGVGAAIRGGDILSGIGQGALTGAKIGATAGAIGPAVGDWEKTNVSPETARVINSALGGAIQGGVTGSGILTGAAGGALSGFGPGGYVAPANPSSGSPAIVNPSPTKVVTAQGVYTPATGTYVPDNPTNTYDENFGLPLFISDRNDETYPVTQDTSIYPAGDLTNPYAGTVFDPLADKTSIATNTAPEPVEVNSPITNPVATEGDQFSGAGATNDPTKIWDDLGVDTSTKDTGVVNPNTTIFTPNPGGETTTTYPETSYNPDGTVVVADPTIYTDGKIPDDNTKTTFTPGQDPVTTPITDTKTTEPPPKTVIPVPPPVIKTGVGDLAGSAALAALIKDILGKTGNDGETPTLTPVAPGSEPDAPDPYDATKRRVAAGAIGSLPAGGNIFSIALPQAGPINAALWNSQNVYGARQPQ